MKDSLVINDMTYEFNDDDEFKGYKFVSIKKIRKDNEGKERFQSVTVKPKDWIEVRNWLVKCLKESEEAENKDPVPF